MIRSVQEGMGGDGELRGNKHRGQVSTLDRQNFFDMVLENLNNQGCSDGTTFKN
jgi:hypothetical protein